MLWSFGFATSHDGLWRRGTDEAARLLEGNMRIAIEGYLHAAKRQQIERLLRDRTEELERDGNSPAVEWQKFDWLA